jgi:hypothetical protein
MLSEGEVKATDDEIKGIESYREVSSNMTNVLVAGLAVNTLDGS